MKLRICIYTDFPSLVEISPCSKKVIADLGLNLMQPYISDSKRFYKDGTENQRLVFRSTLMPANEKLMSGCHLDDFINELVQIIQ